MMKRLLFTALCPALFLCACAQSSSTTGEGSSDTGAKVAKGAVRAVIMKAAGTPAKVASGVAQAAQTVGSKVQDQPEDE